MVFWLSNSRASNRATFCSMVSSRSGLSSSMADMKESLAEGNSGREEGVGGLGGAESVEAELEALNRTMAPMQGTDSVLCGILF